jgi:hypothetical protein
VVPDAETHLATEPSSPGILEDLKARKAIFHRPGFGTIRADLDKMTVQGQGDCAGLITHAAMISPRKQVHMQEFSSKPTCLSNVIFALRNALLKRGE